MATQSFNIYAPLHQFRGVGDCLELSPGFWIRRSKKMPSLGSSIENLGISDRDKLRSAEHCLILNWENGDEVSASEHINLALLAFWLVRPTQTHVAFRFETGSGEVIAGVSRYLDRFQFNSDAVEDSFNDSDLRSAGEFYKVLQGFCTRRGRLNNALLMTLSGCQSYRWEVALLNYAAAAEALLTFSDGPGITKRLSETYALIIEARQDRRDAAFQEFYNLYSMRSDVMHGRVHNVPSSERLPGLAEFSDAVRKLWRAVIAKSLLAEALEGTDLQRQTYFSQIRAGYSASQLPRRLTKKASSP